MTKHRQPGASQAKETAQKRSLRAAKPVEQGPLAATQQVDPLLLQRAVIDPGAASAESILALQSAYGNRAVTGLLAGTSHFIVQAKLRVGPVGDRYEQEADQVAEQVMNVPGQRPVQCQAPEEEGLQAKPSPRVSGGLSLAATITPLVQRQEEDEPAMTKPDVQRIGSKDGSTVDSSVEAATQQTRGSGQLIADNIREPMEHAFGGAPGDDKVKTEAAFDAPEDDKMKTEAAFDAPEDDKMKTEANITWKPLTYTYHAAAFPAHDDRVKAQAVSWPAAAYSSNTANGSSSMVEKPFTVSYKEIDDTANNAWKLGVSSITGGGTITVSTGGSQNAITNPPTTEAKAEQAVKVMKGYYARGSRGSWHTEAASKDHEKYHYREWRETSDHYWPKCRAAIEKLTVSKTVQPIRGLAIVDLKKKADQKVSAFKSKARAYWFTLGDGASDRPYAAGQLTLNRAVKSVQTLAGKKGWTVEQGTNSPSTANPCYQPWLPYNP